ncbi:MAG: electron transport complex subunit RsxB [Methylovulum sp.]|uniref:electron transport complex subunit RsxB n=1 Tax=Methylovulum sp. TaxID=1916980 RepID=UPI0026208D06|nr:electron transport complex subunit RsxB [Methylovulum sp.]MDD2722674.1 electron transport complex subunit RsxB [Methylovulum sp.]MDD5125163.1 electron transport complex subunit RsxB [Methylovulum sp.]
MKHLIEQLNSLLPQTQCGQCSYNGCRPYAEAIATNKADINQCPPGGDEGIAALAEFLGRPPKPLNPEFGVHKPRQVAFIIEQDCIGCVKCIAACPVDAILGAAKFMHTVIASECTGCELCIAPCPVDCIVMQPVAADIGSLGKRENAALAKRRYEARNLRKELEAAEKAERAGLKKAAILKMKAG